MSFKKPFFMSVFIFFVQISNNKKPGGFRIDDTKN